MVICKGVSTQDFVIYKVLGLVLVNESHIVPLNDGRVQSQRVCLMARRVWGVHVHIWRDRQVPQPAQPLLLFQKTLIHVIQCVREHMDRAHCGGWGYK